MKQRSLEVRVAAIRALSHTPVAEVSKKLNIPKTTLYKWQHKWEESHDLTRKTRDFELMNKVNDPLLIRLFAFVDENPHASRQEMAAHLNHQVSIRTINRYLQKRGNTKKRTRFKIPKSKSGFFTVTLYGMTLAQLQELGTLFSECLPEYQGMLHVTMEEPLSSSSSRTRPQR